jgi:dihydrofolate reductase
MRKVVVLMHVSLNGFAASNEGMGLEWTFQGMSEEVAQAANTCLRDVDTAIFGRRTYQGMQGFWSTVPDNPESRPDQIAHARWLDQTAKLVFSTTLADVDWVNSRLIKEHIVEEVNALKQQSGHTMMIFGSPRLIHSFLSLGLIDEYRLFLHPVVLGGGISLFKDSNEMMNLNLVESKTFGNGVVHLRYQST